MLFNKTQGLSVFFSVNSLYLIWIHITPSSEVPTRGLSIQSCCSGSRRAAARPLTLTGFHLAASEDDVMIANSLQIHALEVKLDAERLRHRYGTERIQSPRLRKYLDTTSVEGFPSRHVINQHSNFLSHLLEDYGRVASAIEFVERVKLEEQKYSFSPNYYNQIRILEQKIFGVFRHLCCALERKTTYTIIPVVRPVVEVAINNAERYKRDYTIMKDVDRLFSAISLNYNIQRQVFYELEVLFQRDIVMKREHQNNVTLLHVARRKVPRGKLQLRKS